MTRRPMPREDLARRYPRLLRAMRWVACLATTEAECALDMRRNHGSAYAGEAVNHFGGTLKVVRRAIACRHAARRAYGGRLAV